MFRWKPQGRRIYDFTKLEDGQHVQGWQGRYQRTKIKNGYIERKEEIWAGGSDYLNKTEVILHYSTRYGPIQERLCWKYHNEGFWNNGHSTFELYTINLVKENQGMANKLMALVKLNKNQRKLAKAGIYDENGNLTADGQEVLLNLLAKDKEAELVELVKDWPEPKKKGKDDED